MQAKGGDGVEVWEMQNIADRIALAVPSLHTLIDQLNEAGEWCPPVLACCGPRTLAYMPWSGSLPIHTVCE